MAVVNIVVEKKNPKGAVIIKKTYQRLCISSPVVNPQLPLPVPTVIVVVVFGVIEVVGVMVGSGDVAVDGGGRGS